MASRQWLTVAQKIGKVTIKERSLGLLALAAAPTRVAGVTVVVNVVVLVSDVATRPLQPQWALGY